MPNAPEMISSALAIDCATRPARKLRRYSSTWKRASQLLGSRTSVTRPASTRQPLAMRMMPPAATVSGDLEEGQHGPGQRMLFEQRVGVDHAEQRVSRGVEAGVERVGLAAVLLVDER